MKDIHSKKNRRGDAMVISAGGVRQHASPVPHNLEFGESKIEIMKKLSPRIAILCKICPTFRTTCDSY